MAAMSLWMPGYWGVVMVSSHWSPHTCPPLALCKCSHKLLTTDDHSYPRPLCFLQPQTQIQLTWMCCTLFIRWQPLPCHSPCHHAFTLTKRIADTPNPSSFSLSLSSFFYVDTDVIDLTLCEWLQMVPIMPLQFVFCMDRLLDCYVIYMCVFACFDVKYQLCLL